jgi:threonine/homoserine/homoserine lactone efflux protein
MVGQFAAFLGVSAIVIVTPGPDTALTIRNTLLGGRRAGIFTAMGVSSGQAAWTLATAAGIAALLAASEPAFVAVKLVGAAYLVWLGVQSLLGAFRGHVRGRSWAPRANGLHPRTALRQGLLSNLGNPKMAAFFPSLLPQFAPQEHAFAVLLGLGFVFCLMTLAWLMAYAFAVARAGDFLGRPAIRRAVDAVTGAVLVALGFRLATERR